MLPSASENKEGNGDASGAGRFGAELREDHTKQAGDRTRNEEEVTNVNI